MSKAPHRWRLFLFLRGCCKRWRFHRCSDKAALSLPNENSVSFATASAASAMIVKTGNSSNSRYSYHSRIGGKGERLGDGAGAQALKHHSLVGLDGVDRAAHLLGNLCHGEPLCRENEHLSLLWAQHYGVSCNPSVMVKRILPEFRLTVTFRFGSLKASVKQTSKTIENNDLIGGSGQGGK